MRSCSGKPDTLKLTGAPQPAHANERGWKDTVIANPGEVTRVVATFDLPGLYVWHCHILEHEDHEMMRAVPRRALGRTLHVISFLPYTRHRGAGDRAALHPTTETR